MSQVMRRSHQVPLSLRLPLYHQICSTVSIVQVLYPPRAPTSSSKVGNIVRVAGGPQRAYMMPEEFQLPNSDVVKKAAVIGRTFIVEHHNTTPHMFIEYVHAADTMVNLYQKRPPSPSEASSLSTHFAVEAIPHWTATLHQQQQPRAQPGLALLRSHQHRPVPGPRGVPL